MRKKTICTGLLLGVLTLLLLTPDIAMAADSIGDILGGGSKTMTASDFSDEVISFGSDIDKGTSFTTEFKKIFLGMNTVFRSIITILTVAAGAMIAFGIEDGKKTAWQFMLGIGLAYNFGWFLFEVFGNTGILMSVDDIAKAHQGTNAAVEILKNSKENGNDDILSEIMAVYSGTIINNGMPVLQAIALRMTIALAALEGGYKIAMDLYSGDKVKFMLTYVFKAGFFCFLIMEWLNIGQALSGFFQAAGFLAAGESGFSTVDPTSADADTTFRPDSIWHNAWAFLELCISGKGASNEAKNVGFGFVDSLEEKGISGIFSLVGGFSISGFVIVIAAIVAVGAMIFISVEMFVARIEFYTMLLLSVVFLPFGVTERLAFLSNSAISLMFNSGAKMMVICFLQVMIAKIFSAYLINLSANPFKSFSIMVQILVMSIFFAYITKKIPELVSSFLNGSPALSGGGMISQATSMASKAAMVAGAGVGALAGTAGAAQAASTMSGAKGLTGKMSALPKAAAQLASGIPQAGGNLLKTGAAAALTSNPLVGGFSRGVKAVAGSDGSMANKGFLHKVQDLAGLTNQNHDPILSKAVEEAGKSASEKSEEKDSKDKGTGGSGKNNGEDTKQANSPVLNNANGGKEKETKEMSQYKENTIERPVTQPLGEKRDSGTFRPAPSGFVGHKTGGSGASSVNNVFNNVNQYATSITDAKNSSSTYNMQGNMQGGSGKK